MGQQGILRTLLLAVVVLLLVALGYRQYGRMKVDVSGPSVWVAKRDLDAGHVVTEGEVEALRVDTVAEGAVTTQTKVIGAKLLGLRKAGETLLVADFRAPVKRVALASQIPEGRVMYTLTFPEFTIPTGDLRAGDRIDVLAVKTASGELARMVAHDAILMARVMNPAAQPASAPSQGGLLESAKVPRLGTSGGSPGGGLNTPPLVLAVYPEDVFPLSEVGSSETIKLILHGQSELDSGRMLTIVPTAVPATVELIVGSRRQEITLQ